MKNNMLETTDTLLKGLTANDQNRWARFYRDYAPWIESHLCKRGLAPQDAEEVVHDTLVELVGIMPTYHYDKTNKGAFHSLLFKIAQNKALDRLRKIKSEADKIERFSAEPLLPSDEDWRREILNIALRRVFADPSVSEVHKVAFRRFVQCGEPAEAVATSLGITVNNLYQIKSRIKNRLTDEIAALQASLENGN